MYDDWQTVASAVASHNVTGNACSLASPTHFATCCAEQHPVEYRILRCTTARRWQTRHAVATPAVIATLIASKTPINADNDGDTSKLSNVDIAAQRYCLGACAGPDAPCAPPTQPKEQTMHKAQGRRYPVACGFRSRPRWSSPVSFPLLATSRVGLAANMA